MAAETRELKKYINELYNTSCLERSFLRSLLLMDSEEVTEYLYASARKVREQWYGKKVYVRGLIEFTNYCRNDCYYCGIRRSNGGVERYRLTHKEIVDCCKTGYMLGYRTFVLQGGEDGYYTKETLAELVAEIHHLFPDCAITLSFGEWAREAYECWYEAGADRYLLRHETASQAHYERLHPRAMSFANRRRCLKDLKEIGYQVGAGFMVGSPFQTVEDILEDIFYLKELEPHMVGIGPFLPQKDTPFGEEKPGSLAMTLKLLAIIRLMHPKVLLPATTALGTISPEGRELGLLAGANVLMPNLSPREVRKLYTLYDNKICTGEEAAECRSCLAHRIQSIGYELVTERGDSLVGKVEQGEESEVAKPIKNYGR